jgi:hypothetical protein
MHRFIAAALILATAACTAGRGPLGDGRLTARANPSEVIATELAFARAARDPGPQWESVQAALRDAPNPAKAIVWEPDQVWASCDGSFALSSGPATHPTGKRTRFATIWQRQDNGEYRWALDQGFDLEDGYAAPEMISARVADCPSTRNFRADRPDRARRADAWAEGRSDDGTLTWRTELRADCGRTLVVSAMQDGSMREVFRRVATAPAVPAGMPAPSC